MRIEERHLKLENLAYIFTLMILVNPCLPRRSVREGVEGAEGQADVPLARRDGVAHVDGADRLDEEGDEQIGEAEVQEQKVERRAAEGLLEQRMVDWSIIPIQSNPLNGPAVSAGCSLAIEQ